MQKDLNIAKVAFIMRPHRYGDLLTSMPLVLQWKRVFPNTAVTLVVSEYTASILPFLQGYDDALILPNDGIPDLTLRTLWKLRKDPFIEFDIAISALSEAPPQSTNSRKINFLLWALKAKQRIAVVRNRLHVLHECLVNRRVSKKQVRLPSINFFHESLRILFPEFYEFPDYLHPKLLLPKDQSLSNLPGLSDLIHYDDSPIIFISTSNNRPHSFPGVSHYVDILNTLYQQLPFRVIVSSKSADLIYAESIVTQLAPPACIVCTKELGDLLKVMNKSDLIFVGDGGLMHMASALDKAMVVLFGRTKFVNWKPLGKKAVCLIHREHAIKIPKNEVIEALLQQLNRCSNNSF